MSKDSSISIVATGLLLISFITIAEVESIGVSYGRDGNNLPPANEVIGLYTTYGIDGIRLYDTNHDILQALRGTNIAVIIDVPEPDVTVIANSDLAAAGWVRDNILPFSHDVNFRYIAVGNELILGSHTNDILPAMNKLQDALQQVGLDGTIKVSTSVSMGVFGKSWLPSESFFSPAIFSTLQSIVGFLAKHGSPLLFNVYPYSSLIESNGNITLDFALFTAGGIVFSDNGLDYQNLFDAMVDALFSSLEKVEGGSTVNVVVSETGWPSDSGGVATRQNAQTFISNLIDHVKKGTPKKPGKIETYIFDLFDENLKQPQGIENHYGLFTPTKEPKYSLKFN
ncbi:glucan endo-1,3-beta-glucosidase-like [Phalaenopsis equestris]|uniref:glucan endo-1,3-beta-glucosidase-like n=1 Tax=Phalaenopsis equestris TaxID=78828 RepID=UPI0009E38EBF|nr:glucan endo-1,3-beta-glucosidase-like [Phalaenopsis equestris]